MKESSDKQCGDIDEDARKWLKPATASIQRLEQIKTNVYNLGFTDPKVLTDKKQPPHRTDHETDMAASHKSTSQKTGYSKEDGSTGPPLTKLKSTCAWGSNPSIPNLIHQQNERQRSRPESAKVSRANRPLSGKKQRPHSAKDTQPDNAAVTADQQPPKLAGIKGAKCDPSFRPDGASVNLAGSGWVTAPNVTSEVTPKQTDEALQQVIDSQQEYEYLYSNDHVKQDVFVDLPVTGGYESDGEVIPPPPRASPDFMHILESQDKALQGEGSINNMVDNLLNIGERSSQINPRKQKKPDPAPIRLPVAEEEEDDIRFSFELDSSEDVRVQKYSTHHQKHSTNHNKKSAKAWPDTGSPHTLVRDFQMTNLENSSQVAKSETTKPTTDEELFAYPKKVEVNLVIENKGDIPKSDGTKHHGNVHFDDNRNMTFDITPREQKPRPLSGKSLGYSGRSDLRHVKSRTDSGVSNHGNRATTARQRRNDEHIDDCAGTGTAQSDRSKNVSSPKLSTLTVNFGDGDSDPEPGHSVLRGFKKVGPRHTRDTDTAASHVLPLSDDLDLSGSASDGHTTDEEFKGSQFVQRLSKSGRNHYEQAKSSRHFRTRSESDTEDGKSKIKTIKTIELTGEGLVKETISLSTIENAEQKLRKEYIAPRPPSAARNKNRPTSATSKKPDAPSNHAKTHVTRDGVALGQRPEARLGFRGDENYHPDGNNIDIQGSALKRDRVSSAPTVRSGRKISDVIRLNRDRPPSGRQICGCKRNSHTHAKSSSNLKPETTTTMAAKPSRDKSARRYYTGYAVPENKKKMDTTVYDGKIVEIWTRKEDFEIETEGVKECKDLQMKLLEAGVPVTLETLKRGLLPPTEYGFSGPTYKSTVHPILPPNYTDNLLNNPKSSWLSRENKQVMEAKRRVRDATRALEEQRVEEARLALAAETKALRKNTKTRKGKKKRSKSVN